MGRSSKKNQFQKVLIAKYVLMGIHRLILPNITIGDVIVIRGSTVLSRNISPGTLWGILSTEPIARVSVLLTQGNTYDEFIKGLLPIKKER